MFSTVTLTLSLSIRSIIRAKRCFQHSNPVHAAMHKRLISAFVQNDRYIIVREEDDDDGGDDENGNAMKFPDVWLRDNCRCPQCFHQSSQSRRIDWDKFDIKVKVQDISTDKLEKSIKVKWSDQHSSTYDLEWLRERDFNATRRNKYLTEFYRPKPVHWQKSDFNKVTNVFKFDDVINNDNELKKWLESLAVYGVAIIEESPLQKDVVRRLAERIGFIRKTTYGEEFIVQSKPGAKNYAYLSHPLPLHTDLPYYEYKPSVNILHCMVQSVSKGGSNTLVDAFYIADQMKLNYPNHFKVLTETIVDWNDIGSEDGKSFHNIWRSPVICLDKEGNYTRINHSIPQRDSHFSTDIENVIPWYEAYSKFVQLAREEAAEFKTKPGDVLTFNNIRLLHGRTGYDDTEENIRYVVGAYLDWDIIYSKLRILKSKSGC
ncbi:gamma-butyrobetaine dioxygenase [Episyrphus balteatus]|uniref:gamma-butyrobetaine dioxygenase n=1 Tax=Episyrphus balteatus TaxID=286459 RepID=UPI002486AFED|nr:gamma-butyrobetaine dioxygenase [Episyrphus balteatus]